MASWKYVLRPPAHLGYLGHRFEVIMFDAGSERPLEAVVAGHSNITAL
jgi:hypothetical protein